MTGVGRHWLCEYHGCDAAALDDEGGLRTLLVRAVEAAGATVVTTVLHRFAPQGVSGVVVIEESHLAIHTWPELGYAAVDFYTCGDGSPDAAHQVLLAGLGAAEAEVVTVERGQGPERAMRVHGPRREGRRRAS